MGWLWGALPTADDEAKISRALVRRALARRPVGFVALFALSAGLLVAACGPLHPGAQHCPRRDYQLPPSMSANLIAVIPRISAGAARWGFRELADLLPLLARPGLELHVLYTQDADDLTEGGGDGGPPQVLATSAPNAPGIRVAGAPAEPNDPTSLSAQLYCQRMAAWQARAVTTLRTISARRAAKATAWASRAAAHVRALASKPIPDSSGPEAGAEIDSAASIFAAAQVAEASPHPTIVFFGELSALLPPVQRFSFPGRLIDLVRSDDPTLVLHSEAIWARWAKRRGGTFEAVSANGDAASIAQAIDGGR